MWEGFNMTLSKGHHARVIRALALCLAAVPATAVATPILITNPSFETPDCDIAGNCNNPSFSTGSFDGWTVSSGSGGVFDPGLFAATSAAGYAAPDGDQVGWSNSGTLSQVLTETLRANTTYMLTIDVGRRPDTAFPGYEVSLFAGGVLLALFDESDFAPASNSFVTGSLTFTALASDPNLGQALEIRLHSQGVQTNWDDVRLDAVTDAVPEPGVVGLMALGLLSFAGRFRRRH